MREDKFGSCRGEGWRRGDGVADAPVDKDAEKEARKKREKRREEGDDRRVGAAGKRGREGCLRLKCREEDGGGEAGVGG